MAVREGQRLVQRCEEIAIRETECCGFRPPHRPDQVPVNVKFVPRPPIDGPWGVEFFSPLDTGTVLQLVVVVMTDIHTLDASDDSLDGGVL